MATHLAIALASAALLYRLHFGRWFHLLLGEGFGQHRTALFFFALEVAMEAFLILQVGIQPDYLFFYYALVLVMAALMAGVVVYLSQQLDSARKLEAQRDVIAQQQLYEGDFDYIVKEGDQAGPAVARCLEAVHARLLDERRDPAEVFSLRIGDEIRHIPLADILFFEAAPKAHHVYLHTVDSRLDFAGSLNELEKELGGRFIRVHRAYLAAWDKIEAVDGKENQVRVGGRTCLLSRTGKAELKKKWSGGF